MSRRARPYPPELDRITVTVLQLIGQCAGTRCPTIREISSITTIPQRRVRDFLGGLCERGLIEMETIDPAPARRYRLRVFNGAWTDWTARCRENAAA